MICNSKYRPTAHKLFTPLQYMKNKQLNLNKYPLPKNRNRKAETVENSNLVPEEGGLVRCNFLPAKALLPLPFTDFVASRNLDKKNIVTFLPYTEKGEGLQIHTTLVVQPFQLTH